METAAGLWKGMIPIPPLAAKELTEFEPAPKGAPSSDVIVWIPAIMMLLPRFGRFAEEVHGWLPEPDMGSNSPFGQSLRNRTSMSRSVRPTNSRH
jgi:hypothetical protein